MSKCRNPDLLAKVIADAMRPIVARLISLESDFAKHLCVHHGHPLPAPPGSSLREDCGGREDTCGQRDAPDTRDLGASRDASDARDLEEPRDASDARE